MGRRLRVLDLFAGKRGWSQPFIDAGDEVVTLDIEPKFGADHVRDIMTVYDLREFERSGPFDIVFASPPCNTYSMASVGHHWAPGRVPDTDAAIVGLSVMQRTFALKDRYLHDRPGTYYVIENPVGLMRKLSPVPPTVTVDQCHYGNSARKRTDLWTNAPVKWAPPCHNGRGHPADDCCCKDHAPAPRGSKTPGSTQGKNGADVRAEISRGLAEAIRSAIVI